jgi:hypothetical protein
MFGEDVDLTIDRVSFFRRLANKNNPDNAILNEDCIIVRKPLNTEGAEGTVQGIVSSPPFAGVLAGQEEFDKKRAVDPNSSRYGRKSFEGTSDEYGQSPGQLGNMKEGNIGDVIKYVV